MTPLDLFTLRGIPSGGISILIDVPLRLSHVGVRASFGWTPERRNPGVNIPRGTLISRLAFERICVAAVGGHMTRQAARQYARILLLLTCHDVFEAPGGDTTHL